METANPFQVQPCVFENAKQGARIIIEDKEPTVPAENIYIIRARKITTVEYRVPQTSPDDAVYEVESGGMEGDEEVEEFESYYDIEIVDVEYSEVNYRYTVDIDVVIRGAGDDVGEATDAMWGILGSLDGTTRNFGDNAEVEVTGCNIVGSEEL